MGRYFGTDGFRGRFGSELTLEHALKIGKFLGFYYKTKGYQGIVIGRDTRESGPFLKTAIAKGINESGMNVYDLDVIPTPGVAYIAKSYTMPGVVISASHNPYWDNGIKLLNENGEKMEDSIILAVEEFMDSDNLDYKADCIGQTISFKAGIDEYINHLVSKALDYTGIHIVIDLANGAASMVAKEVFKRLNANVEFLNDNPNGKNINDGCGSTVMEYVSMHSQNKNLDASFAYDGDADRCLFLDENHQILSGDHILYLCGKDLKDENKLKNNTIVATIMSNLGLFKALDKLNISYEKTNVGDKNVYEAMKLNGYSIGGEQSGHIIFMEDATTGDGILTSIKILNVIAKKKEKLSSLLKDFKEFPQVLKNVIVNDKNEVLKNEELKEFIKTEEDKLEGNGRVLVRTSGTEPKIRVMVEADTKDTCQTIVDKIIDKIKALGYTKD